MTEGQRQPRRRTGAHDATPAPAGHAPDKAGLVLLSLILVAAVANLNLSVANVALPDIGAAFDASQTALDLVAVGYSLGLAASVLWLGALGDRYGRKLMLILGVLLSIPACLLAAFAPTIEVLIVARIIGGVSAGMAYPTTLALIAALWSGPGRTRSIALWSALGGAIAALGPLVSGFLLERFEWGSVFLVTLPLAVVALVMASGSCPPTSTRRPRRSTTWAGSCRRCWSERRSSASTSRRSRTRRTRPRPVRHRDRRRGRLRRPPAAGRQPAVRPRYRFAPRVLGRCVGRDHRVRVAHGRDVHRPAISPERARLLDLRRRRVDHPGRPVHGHRGAALSEARRGARGALHAPARIRVRDARVPDDVPAVEGRQPLLGWSHWATRCVGIGVGFAGTPASHSLTGRCRSLGLGWRRGRRISSATSAARSCSRSSARCSTAGYAAAVSAAHRRRPERRPDHEQHAGPTHEVVLERRGRRRPVPAVRVCDHGRGQDVVPRRRRWAYLAGIIAVLVGGAIVFFLFPKKADEERLLAEYHAQDTRRETASPA